MLVVGAAVLGAAYAVAVATASAAPGGGAVVSPSQLTPEAIVALPPRPDYVYTPPADDPLVDRARRPSRRFPERTATTPPTCGAR